MTYQINYTIPYFTGLPRDVLVNTWHFNWTGGSAPTSTNFTALRDAISNFYETIFTGPTVGQMAPWLQISNVGLKVYDLSLPAPRVPVSIMTDALSVSVSSGGSTFVPETAVCASYHGGFVSGQPSARRRGRIYIGGIGLGFSSGSATTLPGPAPAMIAAINTAMVNLAASVATTNWRWVVWSKTNQSSIPVIGGWVDNAPDTQRRRGTSPSVRTSWGTTTPP